MWKPPIPSASTRALGLVREADPPVVEAEHPVACREEIVHLEGPALQVVGQAVH
jgi:hypothetical protein